MSEVIAGRLIGVAVTIIAIVLISGVWTKWITFVKKGFLNKTIKRTPNWEHFFCGLCIGQLGLGIIWRKKNQNILAINYRDKQMTCKSEEEEG